MTAIYLDMKRLTKAVKEHLAARGEKWCPSCKWPLSVEAFGRCKSHPDGLGRKCRQCNKTVQARFRSQNPEKEKAAQSRYYAKNKEKVRAIVARWADKNPEKVKAAGARWRAENPEKGAANKAKRRARKLSATPSWLTDEHRAEIEHHYRLANLLNRLFCTPGAWHVDHIAPLNNEDISGLHVPWNLRVITAKENLSKSNKLIPELVDKGGLC